MVDDRIQLSRRKILAGLGAVGAAGAGAGLGTSALFSDTEGFEGNTLAAGELDLKIDWQQTYDGPPDDDFPAYADAGYPWVNAHPDEGEADDPNGIQSIDSDRYASVDDDGVVTYEDADANIQEYLTCETLDQEYDFGEGQDHLVELGDVKPGDSGEVTFSFHLCDNPGYVWFCAAPDDEAIAENGTTEPEAASDAEVDGTVELLDAVHVRTWYDVDCDNDHAAEEELLAGSPTTLRSLLPNFDAGDGDDCLLLDASNYPGIVPDEESQDCLGLGRVEFTETGLSATAAEDRVIRVQEDPLEYWFQLRDPDHDASDDVVLRFFEIRDSGGVVDSDGDLTDVVAFDWEVVLDETVTGNVGAADGQTFDSDDVGMCRSIITAEDGTTNEADLVGNSCSKGEDDVVSPSPGSDVASFELFYCAPGTGDPVCFPDGQTYCLGFEWWVPASVGNEIQSDSVGFNLGFYTEQCRNNDGSGPVDFSS